MHVWSPIANSAIDIICGPLLPCVFDAELGLQNPGNPETPIAGVRNTDGTITFHLSAPEVQLINGSNARLRLTTEHTLIPGSPNPKWGWRYTVTPAPAGVTVTELGAPVALDPQGYFDSGLAAYPAPPVVLTTKMIDFQ